MQTLFTFKFTKGVFNAWRLISNRQSNELVYKTTTKIGHPTHSYPAEVSCHQ